MASTPFELKGKTIFIARHRGTVGATITATADMDVLGPSGQAAE